MKSIPVPRNDREREALALMIKVLLHVKVYYTFYGAMVERLHLKIDHRHPTMYTDAVVLGFSPEFVMKQKFEHLCYIVVHEVTHCALGHPFRRGVRDPQTFNEACDHVVNLALNKDPTLLSMFPGDGLADARFEGMAVEQVYPILWAEKRGKREQEQGEPQKEKQELDGASGMWGDCCDAGASGEDLDDAASGEEEEEKQEDAKSTEPEEGEEEQEDEDEASSGEPEGDAGEDDDEDDGGDSDSAGDSEEDEEEGAEAEAAGGDPEDDPDAEEEGEGDEREPSEVPEDEGEASQDSVAGSGAGGSTGELDGSLSEGSSKLDDAELAALQHEWEQAVMTAQLAAGGEIEASMARAIGNSTVERKDFSAYVDEFAHATCAVEDSWSRPNRRYETYLPSRCAPGVKIMVVGIDTSGSVTADDLALMQQSAQGVLEDFGLKEMHVVYCDSAIRGIEIFRPGDEVKLTARGGGGTRFHPVFRYALELEQQGEELAGVIYCSDLMGPLDDAEEFEHIQTLWVDVTKYGAKRYRDAPSNIGRVVSVYA